jgi:3,4-dihydroxy 2-butanone 4-phosphate synthase/GTP cyclohydrolase II
MTPERIDRLGLPMMAVNNSSRHETAFTVSIEAREGVTTGISAADRARTIAAAINEQNTMAAIATPGHVFPLRARRGGVLVRAGHTEAAVDIARLAGLNPAGVICEIMKDDGSMARLPDLVAFAAEHRLKIGTISDLIAYRHKHDNLVIETRRARVTSCFGGEWEMRIFADQITGTEHVATDRRASCRARWRSSPARGAARCSCSASRTRNWRAKWPATMARARSSIPGWARRSWR